MCTQLCSRSGGKKRNDKRSFKRKSWYCRSSYSRLRRVPLPRPTLLKSDGWPTLPASYRPQALLAARTHGSACRYRVRWHHAYGHCRSPRIGRIRRTSSPGRGLRSLPSPYNHPLASDFSALSCLANQAHPYDLPRSPLRQRAMNHPLKPSTLISRQGRRGSLTTVLLEERSQSSATVYKYIRNTIGSYLKTCT